MVVYIYKDKGVSAESLTHTIYTLKNCLSEKCKILTLSAKEVIEGLWEQDADLFVMPGGRDIPYYRALKGKGDERIRTFVQNGGSFIGICAGSYYAGSYVDFAKNTDLEVQGGRGLSFFPGIVKGPILSSYDYLTKIGARAERISTEEGDEYPVFYDGGGCFLDAAGQENVTVIASYSIGKEYPAIISCKVGAGIALLSGVHIEYEPSLLDRKDPYLARLIPSLEKGNEERKYFVRDLILRIGKSRSYSF
jgi:biotin--protein ligase